MPIDCLTTKVTMRFHVSARKRKIFISSAFLVICCLYIWGVAPFLLKPAEIVSMRTVVSKHVVPNSKGRCRQWDQSHLICLPNVFLLGASKTGSSSWFNYLVHHPNVASVHRRAKTRYDTSNEVHRFDNPWFHFYPLKISRAMEWAASPLVSNQSTSVVHYTPQYIYAPSVPYDMHNFYPHTEAMKFVVILRNPVDRAISSYWFKNSKMFNKDNIDRGSIRDFMRNFKLEKKRREAFEECLGDNDLYTVHREASLLTRKELSSNFDNLQKCFGADFRHPKLGLRHIDKGIYIDQLDRWLQNFRRNQFHIMLYEEWVENPLQGYLQVMAFLGQEVLGPQGFHSVSDIEGFLHRKFGVIHNTKRQELPSSTRRDVECFYEPYNVKLAQLLKRGSIFNSSTLSCP